MVVRVPSICEVVSTFPSTIVVYFCGSAMFSSTTILNERKIFWEFHVSVRDVLKSGVKSDSRYH